MCSIDEVANYMEVGWFIRLFEEIKDCKNTQCVAESFFLHPKKNSF